MINKRRLAIYCTVFLCFLAVIIINLFELGFLRYLGIFILLLLVVVVVFAILRARSNDEFQRLVEEAPYGIVITRKKKIVFINQKGTELLGGKFIIGKPLEVYLKDFTPSIRNSEGKTKFTRILEGRLIHPADNQEFFVEVKFMPFVYKGSVSEYIVIRDITELKKSQELIQQSEKLSVLGELAAGIAHEIRNPLTSIKGFAQLIHKDSKQEVIKSYSEIMDAEIERINGIVGELLLLAKPKKINLEKTKLSILIDDVVILLNTQAILHNVQIHTEYYSREVYVNCEKNKLKQVFINLIKNGIEAIENGGIIEIKVEHQRQGIIVRIIDNGCGIRKEMLDKIGSAFVSTKEKGTGLGLMICHSIIHEHGGKLTIESENGKGTTVIMSLPTYSERT
ncbi:ATP-binding protein [Fredinandcohnia sp. 179-A 10B2 NHS]|uniref:ATP-binding protein n=1 Tax=Fredinandcohnia sp. 179-A 10B2 NHS TaxID=3235176 RepID=UPI0039A2D7D7